ncbi:UNVERIFIED_CONTAM: hypothetical protein Sangu_2855600 [Sesamum angustifolium]|uniref:Uncharacterized protein n=1 Tax=Sesamum angustifolium TaxID=2727405 RepID=A0AAW2IPA0_9LAMI
MAYLQAVELQKLILAHNDIESLKEDLKNLPLLVVLNVSHNKLTSLPAAIGELHMLKSLDVSFNSIEKIPEEIGSAASLVKFDCSNNVLSSLPCSLGHCINLAELKIPSDGFRAASKLQILDLSGTSGSLPENPAFSSLPELQELYLSRMQISSFPLDIMTLQQLRILDLSQNSLQSIPESIKDLTSLTELNLSDNNISSLPPNLGLLEAHLKVLKLEGNPLRRIFLIDELCLGYDELS